MLKAKRTEIILIIACSFVTILFYHQQLSNLFKTDFNKRGYYYSQQFDNSARWINTQNLSEINAELVEGNKELVYRFPKAIKDRIYLKLLLGKPYKQIEEKYKNINSLEIYVNDDFKKEFNYSNLHIGENELDLTSMFSNNENFTIKLKESPVNDNKFNDLIVRRIEISALPESRDFLPNLSLIFTAIFIPFILFCCFRILNLPVVLSYAFSFASLIFYNILCNSFREFFSLYHIYVILGVFLFYILLCQLKKKNDGHSYFFILIILITIAINLRWTEIERVAFATPHPDAWHESGVGYRQYADSIRLFTEDGFIAARPGQPHEPLYPAIAKILFIFFGSSNLHLRFVSFFFSILVVYLTYLVSRALVSNEYIALLATSLIVVNRYLIQQASFGLRLELVTCLLLMLFYYCYQRKEFLKDRCWIILSGAIGGSLLLTQAYYLPVVLFIFGYSILDKKGLSLIKKIVFFILISTIAVSFLAPYKLSLCRASGDLLSDACIYTTDAANFEFAGQSGFPRKKVTLNEYFFKLHTPFQLIGYHFIGATGIFFFLSEEIFNVIQEQNHLLKIFLENRFKGLFQYHFLVLKVLFTLFLSIFAILICLIKRKMRIIVYLIILGCFASLFLYGLTIVKCRVIIQPHRTIAQALPFMAICISYGIYYLFNKFFRIGHRDSLMRKME